MAYSHKVIDPLALNLDVKQYKGEEALVVCPFHNDHHPSATFNVRSGLFHCFTCGTGKKAKQLERELGGTIIYVKSLENAVRNFLHAVDNSWRTALMAPLATGNPYLGKRQVSNGFVHMYRIRAFSNGVGFPIQNNLGQVTGMQIRQLPPKEPRYLFYGVRQPLWPLENLKAFPHPDRPIILTEGVFSALRVMMTGYNSLAVMGAANVLNAARMMSGREFLVLFDGDDAGYIGAAKFAAIGKNSVLVPHGFEADEMDPLELRDFLDGCEYSSDVDIVCENSINPLNTYQLARKFQKSAMR